MKKRKSKHAKILKTAAIWGGAALILIGVIVTEGVETIKTGYLINNLNKIWQEENFKYMTMSEKINFYTDTEKTEVYISRKFKLTRTEPEQIVFINREVKNGTK